MRRSRLLARSVTAVALATAVTPWVAPAVSAATTTVPAPGAGAGATVSVSKTSGLGNESVTVTWSGFRPSSAQQLQNGGDSYDTSTLYPVRVYECRGSDPASSSDCYGSPGFRGSPATGSDPAVAAVPGFTYPGQTDPYANLPDGPANWQDVATAGDGSGQVTLQVFTRREAPSLGCDERRSCSLVVVPNYGRAGGAGAVEDQLDAPWAWERRTVVPLSFLPLDDSCPLGGTPLSVEGSPSSARLMASWRGAACTDATAPVTLDYTSIGEPQTRDDVAAGLSDVGLVTQPLDVDTRPAHPMATAPVAVTGLAIGFQVDDLAGVPVTRMRLNARLVAKLITASYRIAGDDAVAGNPVSLFRDKEFRALNPGVAWPGGSPGNHVLLLGDLSDATYALTSWINADPQARAFLDGTPDEYGTHVNTAYKGLRLPVATFPLLDEKQQDSFQPIQGMDHVARQLSLSQFPGAITTIEDGVAVVTKPSRQPAGRRETLGIIDTADVRAFRIPTVTLVTAGGTDVDADDAGLAGGYPLALPVKALVPTDATGAKKQQVLRFLDYALGRGQVQGDGLGELPSGYLPLTGALRAQALAARAAVVAGPKPAPTPTGTGTPRPSRSASPEPAPSASTPTSPVVVRPGPLPSPVPPGLFTPSLAPRVPPRLPANLVSAPESPGGFGLLPLVLLLGAACLVAGPTAIVLTRRGRGPGWLAT